MNTPVQQNTPITDNRQWNRSYTILRSRLRRPARWQAVLLIVTVILLTGTLAVSLYQPEIQAANPGAGKVCAWYTIRAGDTLTGIALKQRTTINALVNANSIRNANKIYFGQRICIPRPAQAISGLLPNGSVRWYAHNALERSNRAQVEWLLRNAADRYGLPQNLLLAVGWQESGWRQHVIARDGGIGAMQIMPYTAAWINKKTRVQRDPYKLQDNIEMGAIYLRWHWNRFNGDLTKVISAYNQGEWAVVHRGVFNWRYVKSVRALMYNFK